MKYFASLFIIILIVSCSKEKTSFTEETSIPIEKIDTTAIDSFAPGATLNNIKPKAKPVDSLDQNQEKATE